jgi:uncharacterized phage protein (TIGR01671 family)
MREIEFKVWCKGTDSNKNFNIPRWFDVNDYILNKYYTIFDNTEFNEHFEFLQFTGLKDKEGNKIFEGDIIEYQQSYFNVSPEAEKSWIPKRGVIIYDNNLTAFTIQGKLTLTGFDGAGRYNFKVIGNIFNNPELIENFIEN